jgi:outer membrane lipoprotein-sorting protein
VNKRMTILAVATALMAAPASAQGVTANDVLNRLEATGKNLKDFSARLTGTVAGQDQKLKVDMDVLAMPPQDLVRVTFRAPEALADNFVIMDKSKVWNYLFLTNQVTVSPKNKASVSGTTFDFTQIADFTSVIPRDKVNVKLVDTDTTPAGKAYVLEATPKANADLDFDKAKVWVTESGWRLYRVQFSGGKDSTADLTVTEWKANSGLKEATLRKLPKDAEVINKK